MEQSGGESRHTLSLCVTYAWRKKKEEFANFQSFTSAATKIKTLLRAKKSASSALNFFPESESLIPFFFFFFYKDALKSCWQTE
jgi:hypothetical protein